MSQFEPSFFNESLKLPRNSVFTIWWWHHQWTLYRSVHDVMYRSMWSQMPPAECPKPQHEMVVNNTTCLAGDYSWPIELFFEEFQTALSSQQERFWPTMRLISFTALPRAVACIPVVSIASMIPSRSRPLSKSQPLISCASEGTCAADARTALHKWLSSRIQLETRSCFLIWIFT